VLQRPDLSVVIVNWNTRDLLAQCLQSVYDTAGELQIEVIVVDNASADGSVEMVQSRFPQVRLIRNTENVGFTRANNQALAICKGRYALLLNSDAVVLPGSLMTLVRFADAHSKAGIVGARLLNPDGSFQASFTDFPTLWREFLMLSGLGRLLHGRWYPSRGPRQSQQTVQADYVEGACLLVRREAMDEVGVFDEGYFMYAEEVDWCYRMKQAGWEVWFLAQAPIIHYGGGSSRQRRTRSEAELYRSRIRFFHKHYGAEAAARLKMLIYAITAVKGVWHGTLRKLSGGRRGRMVVGWRELRALLEGARP